MKKIIAAFVAAFAFAGASHAFSFDDAAALVQRGAESAAATAVPMVKDAATTARAKTCAMGQTADQNSMIATAKGAMLGGIATITPDFVGGDKIKTAALVEKAKGKVLNGTGTVLQLAC